MTRTPRDLRSHRVPDLDRPAAYRALCAGEFAGGPLGTVVFAVDTLDTHDSHPDLHAAAGLALALAELGHGVRLVDRAHWHVVEDAEVFVALLPDIDPAFVPRSAWRVAWALGDTDRWAATPQLGAYDQVLASSRLAANRLARATPRAGGVLATGVDVRLFRPPPTDAARALAAATTVPLGESPRDVHRALEGLPDDADVVWFGDPGPASARLLRWHRPAVSCDALPEVYRSAGIVIADADAAALGYGSVGRTLLEGAACGSLPVTNGSLGLHDLGLDDVPRYRDAAELSALLAGLRRDPDGLRRRADRLRDVVRARHSWEQRAHHFDRQVIEARAAAAAGGARGAGRALHYFPDWVSANPYQAMLYRDLEAHDAYPVPVTSLSRHLRRAIATPGDPGVVHVHWTAPILQSADGPLRAATRLGEVTDEIERFRARGGRLVWTVHNVLPHDTTHRWAEVELGRLLAASADLVHVMSEATIEAAREHYALDPAKVVVVPHSGYQGEYPDWISRDAARERLGVLPEEKVLVCLGGIRANKGLDTFVDVFDAMAREDPTLRLIVAGLPATGSDLTGLTRRMRRHHRIVLDPRFIAPDQLQVWLRAADLAVLPYRTVLNSGAFRLAETFGLPVVAPRVGSIAGVFGGLAHVRLFDPRDPDSLPRVSRAAVRDLVTDPAGAEAARRSARASAAEVPPLAMSQAFMAAAEPLLGPAGVPADR